MTEVATDLANLLKLASDPKGAQKVVFELKKAKDEHDRSLAALRQERRHRDLKETELSTREAALKKALDVHDQAKAQLGADAQRLSEKLARLDIDRQSVDVTKQELNLLSGKVSDRERQAGILMDEAKKLKAEFEKKLANLKSTVLG